MSATVATHAHHGRGSDKSRGHLFAECAHGNAERCVIRISPEQHETCGLRTCTCIDPITKPPFTGGKYPECPQALRYKHGTSVEDGHAVDQDWLSWMRRLAVASSGGFGFCEELCCFFPPFLFLCGPCILCFSDWKRRRNTKRLIDQMNTEFLGPKQSFAKLFHAIRTEGSGKTAHNLKVSWIAIGLSQAEIEKMKAEPETVGLGDTCCQCCGGSGGV